MPENANSLLCLRSPGKELNQPVVGALENLV